MFLKGDKKPGSAGEIDEYKGIEIEWKRGKKAILTILDDEGKQIEDVKLYELKTRPEMHQLLVDKGFRKKTEEERMTEIQVVRTESQLKAMEPPTAVYQTMTTVYFLAFALIAGK